MMMFRYPDKPTGVMHRAGLYPFESAATGLYFAQAKIDGWRAQIEIGEHVTYMSRHKKPLPVSREVRDWLEPRLRSAFKPGTLLDGEWCARRPGARVEKLWLFDILRDGNEELFGEGAFVRFERLSVLAETQLAEHIVPSVTHKFEEFFDALAPGGEWHMPEAEGIVLKARSSLYIGSVRESASNPAWTRCKWRAGEDGQTRVA